MPGRSRPSADDRNRYGGLRAWGSASFIVVVAFTGALIERAGITSMFVVYIAALLVLAVVSLPLRGDSARAAAAASRRHRRRAPPPAARAVPSGRSARVVGLDGDQLVFLDPPDRARRTRRAGRLGVGHRRARRDPDHGCLPVLARRVGGERLLVIGAAIFALRAAVLSLVSDPLLAAATMALHGAAFALVLVGGVTFVSRHAPVATAATAQGILSATVFSIAMIIGPGHRLLGRRAVRRAGAVHARVDEAPWRSPSSGLRCAAQARIRPS